MSSRAVDVAEAVKDSLNAATTLNQQITAFRKYRDITRRRGATEMMVRVDIASIETDLATRARGLQEDIRVRLFFTKPAALKNGDFDEDDVDANLELVEKSVDHLATAGVMSGAGLAGISRDPPWEPEQLDSVHMFTAEVIAVYRGIKSE